MRPVREITAQEENFRAVPMGPFDVIRRDPIEPEPIGTIVLTAFRVVGYDPDCDGSLMARLEHIDKDGEPTGWEQNAVGLYPDTELVVTLDELKALFAKS
jgi:hypothetical protein